MNYKELPKLIGKRLRLRPIPRRLEGSGKELEHRDGLWLIENVSADGVDLSDVECRESVRLKKDHIHEYRTDPSGESDGFLLLHCEIRMRGKRIVVEPFHYRHSVEQLWERIVEFESEVDDSLRLAKGLIIEGPSPLQVFAFGKLPCVEIRSFEARFVGADSAVYYNTGSIGGLSPGRTYYVYGIDPGRRGGAITYLAAANLWEALANPETIYIGRILLPGGPDA